MSNDLVKRFKEAILEEYGTTRWGKEIESVDEGTKAQAILSDFLPLLTSEGGKIELDGRLESFAVKLSVPKVELSESLKSLLGSCWNEMGDEGRERFRDAFLKVWGPGES